jgi:hypothetical protein
LSLIEEALGFYGFKGGRHEPTREHWCALTAELGGDWMKVAKYKLAAFKASQRGLTPPKSPFSVVQDKPHMLIGGAARQFIKNMRISPQFPSLLQTITQTKKGMPRPSKEQLKQAELKHVEKMTAPVELKRETADLQIPWEDFDLYPPQVEVGVNRITMEQQLRRTVREIFGEDAKGGQKAATYDFNDRIKAFFPSTSANYINSRSAAGAVGTILQHPTLMQGLRVGGGWYRVTDSAQEPKEEEAQQNERKTVEERQTIISGDKKLQEAFGTLWFRCLKLAESESPDVEPVALAEALKVRVITKGPPLLQTVMRPLWKCLHSRLRKHPVFTLIGKPVDEEYVLNQMGRNLNDDEEYLSADYEGATDNLKSWVSECIADELSAVLNLLPVERALFKRSLTQHIYEGHKPQTTGQLMGSITSFPVLCIANAAVCRWAMEIAEKRVIKLKNARLMINGDDACMRSKKGLYRIWQIISAFAGLKESLGKTFHSREFLDINSTNFERVSDPKRIPCESKDGGRVMRETFLVQTKFVNMGLLSGLKRSQGGIGLDDQDDPRNNIGCRARELLRHAPEELHAVLMKSFILRHKDILDKTRQVPWYIPEWLGGLGLPSGDWGTPSETDLRLARLILINWKKERPISLAHQNVAWQTWRLAEKRLPDAVFYLPEKTIYSEIYNEVMGKLVVNLLFDANIELDDLKEAATGGNVGRALKKNARLWSPLGKQLPAPLKEHELRFLAQHPALPPIAGMPYYFGQHSTAIPVRASTKHWGVRVSALD